ncbi:MAG: Fic family protein, partial [Myxococcaceae bacterium]
MVKNKPDISEDISLMEPLLIRESSKHRASLAELVFTLTKLSSSFRKSLPSGVHHALVHLVRSMNCYYSNLIEGHNTHPIEIERALKNDYSADVQKRDLQLEAKAHIEVQTWIEEAGLQQAPTCMTSILEIHRRFCEHLPEDLLWVSGLEDNKKEKNKPGEFRKHDVRVGQHIAIHPNSIEQFLKHFESTFGKLGPSETVLASAAAHHRFLWIHPFLDGNGRVARLISHAMLLNTLETGGVWSISRGLARNVQAYKSHLANCDLTRRNDLDGRGNLSEEALADFTKFFLEVCI